MKMINYAINLSIDTAAVKIGLKPAKKEKKKRITAVMWTVVTSECSTLEIRIDDLDSATVKAHV